MSASTCKHSHNQVVGRQRELRAAAHGIDCVVHRQRELRAAAHGIDCAVHRQRELRAAAHGIDCAVHRQYHRRSSYFVTDASGCDRRRAGKIDPYDGHSNILRRLGFSR
eukprot:COSAG02_NODE_785_length_17228_cov_24.082141_16_plen_109_part_00